MCCSFDDLIIDSDDEIPGEASGDFEICGQKGIEILSVLFVVALEKKIG